MFCLVHCISSHPVPAQLQSVTEPPSHLTPVSCRVLHISVQCRVSKQFSSSSKPLSSVMASSSSSGGGEGSKVLQFKVVLEETDPVIWRRFQVKSDPNFKFWDLHVAIQDVMGWDDKHLHRFRITNPDNGKSVSIGKPLNGDAWSIDEVTQEGLTNNNSMAQVRAMLAAQGMDLDDFDTYGKVFASWKVPLSKYYYDSEASKKFVTEYKYDFGDNWGHDLIFEGIFPADPVQSYPRCLEGERAAIPEDLGGTVRIRELHETLAKPAKKRNKDEREKLEWLEECMPNYDPAKFDPAEVEFRDSRMWLHMRRTYKMKISTTTWYMGSSDKKTVKKIGKDVK